MADFDKAKENIIEGHSRFDGKNLSCYVESYKAKLHMRTILDAR